MIPETSTTSATDKIAAHVTQLAQCERGRQALADLYRLLNNGGSGLDRNNSRALVGLLLECYTGRAGSTLDALRPYHREKR